MFRRSGSFTAFHVEGKVPDPRTGAFAEALASQRFRTIEHAASEERSVGWASPGDPTGDTHALEDMDLDAGIWLRVRFDHKKLPAIWLTIHRTEAERSAGRKLSARERKDLKDDLSSRLLPRILPSVRLVDVLYDRKRELVLLFGTSNAVREEFVKLFFRTFATTLVPADAYQLAARAGLDRDTRAYLDEVAPVRWMRGEKPRFGPKPGVRVEEAAREDAEFEAAAAADDEDLATEEVQA